MFYYFLWNIPRFFSSRKCKTIFCEIFGIVRITMLRSNGFTHSGRAKLVTSHRLDFVTSNKNALNIGTRFPVFIKEDESISSNTETSYCELEVEQSFENCMDTPDGFLQQNTTTFLQDDLPQEQDLLQNTANVLTKTSLKRSGLLFSCDINSDCDLVGLCCNNIGGIDIKTTALKRFKIEAKPSHNINSTLNIKNETNFRRDIDKLTSMSITPYNGLNNLSYEDERIGIVFRDGPHRHHINFENLQGFYQDYNLYSSLLVDLVNGCRSQDVMEEECESTVRKIKSRAHHWKSLFTID